MVDQVNRIQKLPLAGALRIQTLSFPDPRGSFNVVLTGPTLEQNGVHFDLKMEFRSVSKKGVLRGLHYQAGEHAQAKLVSCTWGEAYDVLVDLRKSSPTFGKWTGVHLRAQDGQTLYIPRGFAHGYLALSQEAELHYMADNMYEPSAERGVHYADPELKIDWPIKTPPLLSKRDMIWPTWSKCEKFE